MVITKTGVGVSSHTNSNEAIKEAVEKALLNISDPDFSLIYFTEDYDPKTIFEIGKSYFKNFIGACVPGIISGEQVMQKGVGVYCLTGNDIEVVTNLNKIDQDEVYKTGQEIGNNYLGYEDGTLFIFPDGYASNISDLLRGIQSKLGSSFQYIGGGTGDNLNFNKTYQLTDKGFASNSVSTALIRGIDFRVNLGHGWEPKSEPVIITKAEGKRVYELDGEKAFKRYSDLLGGISKEHFSYYGMKYPLGIPAKDLNFLIRDPIELKSDGSIIFITEIPENTAAVIMEGDTENLISAAEDTASSFGEKDYKTVLLFDCISRYLLMKDDFERELRNINNNFETKLFGALTFGEISNITNNLFLYNKTLVILAGD